MWAKEYSLLYYYRSKQLEATEISINGDLMSCQQMENHPVLEKNDMTLYVVT